MRTLTPIDMDLVVAVIKEVEAEGPLENLSVLYTVVAERMNGLDGDHPVVTPAMVKKRIEKFELAVKTQKGKRGIKPGQKRARVSTEDGVDLSAIRMENFDDIFENAKHGFKSIAKRAGEGDIKAVLYLKCADCMGWDAQEIFNCSIRSCSLWSFRPQPSDVDPELRLEVLEEAS